MKITHQNKVSTKYTKYTKIGEQSKKSRNNSARSLLLEELTKPDVLITAITTAITAITVPQTVGWYRDKRREKKLRAKGHIVDNICGYKNPFNGNVCGGPLMTVSTDNPDVFGNTVWVCALHEHHIFDYRGKLIKMNKKRVQE